MESKKIPIIENVSYDYFYEKFLKPNKVCIIKNLNKHWNSSNLWIKSNKPNFDYLERNYGKLLVTIYECGERHFNSQKTFKMQFKDYLIYWKNYIDKNYSKELPLLYLKDWHLKNEFKDDDFYEVPIYFSSDWLNEYLVESEMDDYRFVYMGPKETWTPFHQDVFKSYSWSINICGKKKWILFPPGEENILKDSFGNLPFNLDTIPNNINYFEVIQNAGDAIFVPSGWYHQVLNLDDTISINHNWINGCNIKFMLESLILNHSLVKAELKDCEDMENYLEQSQLVLKSLFGMDFQDFLKFLHFIVSKRLNSFQLTDNLRNSITSNKYVHYDLLTSKEVLELFINKIRSENNPNLKKIESKALEIISLINI